MRAKGIGVSCLLQLVWSVSARNIRRIKVRVYLLYTSNVANTDKLPHSVSNPSHGAVDCIDLNDMVLRLWLLGWENIFFFTRFFGRTSFFPLLSFG